MMHGTSSMPVYDDSDEIVAVNPIRYRGYYYDKETGLYYLQSRYYDSETGRFINADRVLGANSDLAAYNLYLFYEGKNIISYSETTWWITVFNPAFQNKKSENLTAIYYIQFTDNGLYNAFRAVYDGDPRLVFYKLNGLNTVMFTF